MKIKLFTGPLVYTRISITLLGLILFLSPLLEASWDVWSKTIIHILTILAVCIYLILMYPRSKLSHNFVIILPLSVWFFVTVLTSRIRFNSELELHNWINYFLIFLTVSSFNKNNSVNLKKILNYTVISAVIMLLIGYYQFFLLKQAPRATMINSNIFAGYLILIIPVLFFLARDFWKKNNSVKTAIYLIIILCVLCLFLTKSAGAIFALITAIFICKYRLKGFIFILSAGILAGILFKYRDPEIINRYYWWMTAFEVIRDFPIFGVGPGNFEFVYTKYRIADLSSLFAHNYYLQLCSETGIIGILLFLGALIIIIPKIKNFYLQVSAIACLIQNVFDYNLYIPANAILFWMILSTCSINAADAVLLKYENKFIVLKEICFFIFITCIITYSASVIRIYSAVSCYAKAKGIIKYSDINEEKNYITAKKNLEKAVRIKKNLWYAYGELADLYGFPDAIAELEKGIKYNPYYPEYYFRLAMLYKKSGEHSKALQYLNKTIEYDPRRGKLYMELFNKRELL